MFTLELEVSAEDYSAVVTDLLNAAPDVDCEDVPDDEVRFPSEERKTVRFMSWSLAYMRAVAERYDRTYAIDDESVEPYIQHHA